MTTPIEADKKENFSEQNKMEENLKKIEDQIKELNDGEKSNDSIEGLQGMLNAEFAKSLTTDIAKNLLKSIDEYTFKLEKGENLPAGLQDLIDFLEPIANPIGELKDGEDGVVGLEEGEVTKGQFYGKLEGLNRLKTEDDKQNTEKQDDKKSGDENKTKGGDDENQVSENNDGKDVELNALEVLNKRIENVDGFIKVEGGKTLDSRLQTLKTTLSNIKKVVENPIKDNTMKLQKFIWETCYKDLDKQNKDRVKYEKYNHMKEGKFDGQFGDVTLEGLNKLLAKIESRITDINQAIEVEEKNKSSENAEALGSIELKNEITLKKGQTSIKAEDLFKNLPDATAEFKDGKGINVQETTKSQEVTVVVKDKDGKKLGEIKITAKIDGDKIKLTKQESGVNGSVESSEGQEGNKSPDGGQDEKPQPKSRLFGGYPREDSVSVSQMDGTVLFASQFVSPEHSGNVGGDGNSEIAELNKKVESAVNTLKNLGLKEGINENVYLMELGNKTLAIRLDSRNCLYPLAVDVATGEQIFLVNNPSCVQYLKNKLRNSLGGNYNVSIGWDGKDYVIGNQSYNKWLTIEPMTIAGKWVSQDLSQCLAFLNFTNYLRNEPGLDRGKFNNDNPDLKLDDNNVYVKVKEMDKNEKRNEDYSRTWMHVDLNQFGIKFDPISLEKFKKYNNHEDWDDNWDKKKENQYSYLDLGAEIKNANKPKVSSSQTGDYISHNPSAVAKGNDIDKPSETGTHVVSLSQVAGGFDNSSFGLDNSAKFYESGPVGNKSYYWLKDQKVFKLESPYFVKQEAILSDGQTFDGNKLSQGLNFKPDGNFNVCEQGAKGLTNEIKNVYKSIKGNNDELDAQITVDDGNYVLKWGEDSSEKTIQLSGDKFLEDGKIFGYDINEPEKWMKVVCYAVDNYDNLAKGDAVSKNESYGIYEDNVSSVKDWMTKLSALEVLNSSSVIGS